MGHPNEGIGRALFEALRTDDAAAIQKLYAADVVLNVPGKNRLSGTYKGLEEFQSAMEKVRELTDGTLTRELHDVTASDTHVVVLTRVSAQRNGKRFSWNGAGVLDIKDGKIAAQWLLSDDPATVDECFA